MIRIFLVSLKKIDSVSESGKAYFHRWRDGWLTMAFVNEAGKRRVLARPVEPNDNSSQIYPREGEWWQENVN